MDLSSEIAIKNEYRKVYEEEVDIVWQELVKLNTNIFLLEKILAFDFESNVANEPTFWAYTVEALYDASILICWKLLSDQNGFRVSVLKNAILKQYLKGECVSVFNHSIREVYLDARLKEEKEKLEIARNKQVAHLDLKDKKSVENVVITISELSSLTALLLDYFKIISFSNKSVLPLQYVPKIGCSAEEQKTDIDFLLEFMKTK